MGRVLVTGDHSGGITYFTPSLRNIQVIPEAHGNSPVRGLAFSPSDAKFQSSGDDATVKIWDWETAREERTYTEHLADVRCSDWHPFRSLVASGSKDNTLKLWDPRQADSLASIYLHKSSIFTCKFNPVSGNYIATGSKDFNVKVFDLRNMREVECYKGHNREIVTLAWHPVHDNILVSGGYNGSMIFWHTDHPGPHSVVTNAHNYSVNLLTFHPLGHIMASGANDGIVKFWCREPPGSKCKVSEFTGSKSGEGVQVNDAAASLEIGHGPYLLDAQATATATMNTMYVKESASSSSAQGGGATPHPASAAKAAATAAAAAAADMTERLVQLPPAQQDARPAYFGRDREARGDSHGHRGGGGDRDNRGNGHAARNGGDSASIGSIYGPGGDAPPRPSSHQPPHAPAPPLPEGDQPTKRSRFS
jgi:polyadenylation factor subunit 2